MLAQGEDDPDDPRNRLDRQRLLRLLGALRRHDERVAARHTVKVWDWQKNVNTPSAR
jgi:hypothetical protein